MEKILGIIDIIFVTIYYIVIGIYYNVFSFLYSFWIKHLKTILGTLLFIVVLIYIPCFIIYIFFDSVLVNQAQLGTVGTVIAGLTAFLVWRTSHDRNKLTEENNLNTTFKDAVTLLGNDNVSVRMGGVYTLIDIAKKNINYTKRINDILCNYIVEQTNLDPYNERHIQELVDLIIIENSQIFYCYKKDLSKSRFINIIFSNYKEEDVFINNIIFINTLFCDSKFNRINLSNIRLENCFSNMQFSILLSIDFCVLSNCEFKKIAYTGGFLIFNDSDLNECNFEQIRLEKELAFYNTCLSSCSFIIEGNTTFLCNNNINIKDCDFYFNKSVFINFSGAKIYKSRVEILSEVEEEINYNNLLTGRYLSYVLFKNNKNEISKKIIQEDKDTIFYDEKEYYTAIWKLKE